MKDEGERAARYSDLFGGNHEHAANCAYCPICAAIGVLRTTRPEVLDHLAGAAREMLAAFSILLEEAEGVVGAVENMRKAQGQTETDGAKVRRIDVG